MKKFKENLLKLLISFKTDEEKIKFLVEKKAFSEDFARKVIEDNFSELTFNDLKNNIKYEVLYENNRILVDITKNDIFSYLDSEDMLIEKMRTYIKTEDYEKAQI